MTFLMRASGDRGEAMVGKGAVIDCLVGLTAHEDGFQDPPVRFLYQPDMKMVCTQAMASQVQDSILLWEGGYLTILEEYTLQRFSFLDLTQMLNEGVFPELAGLLREGCK